MTSDKLNVRIKKNLNELYFNEIAENSKNSNDSIDFHISTKKTNSNQQNMNCHKNFSFLKINDWTSSKKCIINSRWIIQTFDKSHKCCKNFFNDQKCAQMLINTFAIVMFVDDWKFLKTINTINCNQLSWKKKSWQNISLNFVTNLSKNKNRNVILMIVNWFSKMRHYIVCRAEKKISISKKQLNCSFKMFKNCMNCLKRLYRTKIFNLCFWHDELCVKFWTLKSNCQQHFILKRMIKAKFVIKKWNDICVFM